MSSDRPTFAVITPADEEARRFIPLATIRSLTGIPSTGNGSLDDATLQLKIDGVLASCATYCRLAKYRATPPTLGQEEVRATWVDAAAVDRQGYYRANRASQLLLPHRAPITAIVVTEGGTELEEDTDFRHLGAGVLERMTAGAACGWSLGTIVVDYTAGYPADDDENPPPADLVALVADQVRLMHAQSIANPGLLRQEDIPGVWSGTFSTPGGDSISTSGLIRPLVDALERLGLCATPSFA